MYTHGCERGRDRALVYTLGGGSRTVGESYYSSLLLASVIWH